MRVFHAGVWTDLGITEATPTISMSDFSRRETDAFGVTTVVRRGFSRRMSLRFLLPFASVDAVQRKLADLRAVEALWQADSRFSWTSFAGFLKESDLDLAVPPASFCTLSVEGVAETEVVADPGTDPSPAGAASTFKLLRPLAITDAVLTSSSVAEADAPAWVAGTTYPLAGRVIRGHRVYESLVADNVGSEPSANPAKWLDLRPTNRWAMFDQALGTVTSAAGGSIVVTLAGGTSDALALLDVTGSTVRVQGSGYDSTRAVGPGAMTFTGLPNGAITVTITGAGTVAVGTMLIGKITSLGITEASPTAAITDYSRKEVDEFGAVTIVQRAWAKRMTAKALISTDAIDIVANRLASVRAQPSLWIGDSALDSLTIYGFFKDFSIEVGQSVSKLTLSIEGLSKANPVAPATDEDRTAIVFANAVDRPPTPPTGGGPIPVGWSEAPQDITGDESRWWSQADFIDGEQVTDWTLPVAVAGLRAAGKQVNDLVEYNEASGKTDDELVSNNTLSPVEKAVIWDLVYWRFGPFLNELIGKAQKLNIDGQPAQDAFDALTSFLTALPNWSSTTITTPVSASAYLTLRDAFVAARNALKTEIDNVVGGKQSADPIYAVGGGATLAGNKAKGQGTLYSLDAYRGGADFKAIAVAGDVAWGLVEDRNAAGPESIAWGFSLIGGKLSALKNGVAIAELATGLAPPVQAQVDYFDAGTAGETATVGLQSPQGTVLPFQDAIAGKIYYAKAFLLDPASEVHFSFFVGKVPAPYSSIPGAKPPVIGGGGNVARPDITQISGAVTFDNAAKRYTYTGTAQTLYPANHLGSFPLNGARYVGMEVPGVAFSTAPAAAGPATFTIVFNIGGSVAVDLRKDTRIVFEAPAGATSYTFNVSTALTAGTLEHGVPVVAPRSESDIDNAKVLESVNNSGLNAAAFVVPNPSDPGHDMRDPAVIDTGAVPASKFVEGDRETYYHANDVPFGQLAGYQPTYGLKYLWIDGGAIRPIGTPAYASTATGTITARVMVSQNFGTPTLLVEFDASAGVPPEHRYIELPTTGGGWMYHLETEAHLTSAGYLVAHWLSAELRKVRETSNQAIHDYQAPTIVVVDHPPSHYLTYVNPVDPSQVVHDLKEMLPANVAGLSPSDATKVQIATVIERDAAGVVVGVVQTATHDSIAYRRAWNVGLHAGGSADVWNSVGAVTPGSPGAYGWAKAFAAQPGARPVLGETGGANPSPDILMPNPGGGAPIAATVGAIIAPVSSTLVRLMSTDTVIEGATIRNEVAGDYSSGVRGLPIDGPAFAEMEIAAGAWNIVALDDDDTTYVYTDQAAIGMYNSGSGACYIYFGGTIVYNQTLAAGLTGTMRLSSDGWNVAIEVGGVLRAKRAMPVSIKGRVYPKWWAYGLGVRYAGINSGPYTDNRWESKGGKGIPASYATADTLFSLVRGAGYGVELAGNTVTVATANAVSDWYGYVTTSRSITGSQIVTGRLVQGYAAIGLTDAPAGTAEGTSQFAHLDYAIETEDHSSYRIYEAGVLKLTFADGHLGKDYGPETEWAVIYDEFTVKYRADGVLIHTSAATVARSLTLWGAVAVNVGAVATVDKIGYDTHADVTASNVPLMVVRDGQMLPTDKGTALISAGTPASVFARRYKGGEDVTAASQWIANANTGASGTIDNTVGSVSRGRAKLTGLTAAVAIFSLASIHEGVIDRAVTTFRKRFVSGVAGASPFVGISYIYEDFFATGASTSFLAASGRLLLPPSNLAIKIAYDLSVTAAVTSATYNHVQPEIVLQVATTDVSTDWTDAHTLEWVDGAASDYLSAGLRYIDTANFLKAGVVIRAGGAAAPLSARLVMRTPDGDVPLDAPIGAVMFYT